MIDRRAVLGQQQRELVMGHQGVQLGEQLGALRRHVLDLETVERGEQDQRGRIVAGPGVDDGLAVAEKRGLLECASLVKRPQHELPDLLVNLGSPHARQRAVVGAADARVERVGHALVVPVSATPGATAGHDVDPPTAQPAGR